MLDVYKELEPIIYGKNGLKYIFMDHCPPGQVCFNMHWHERIEILYVISGSLELRSKEDSWCLKEGQIAVFGPGQLHEGRAGEKGVAYHVIMFDGERFCNTTFASAKYLQPLIKGQFGFQKCIEDHELSMTVECLIKLANGENDRHPLVTIGMIYEVMGLIHPLANLKDSLISYLHSGLVQRQRCCFRIRTRA